LKSFLIFNTVERVIKGPSFLAGEKNGEQDLHASMKRPLPFLSRRSIRIWSFWVVASDPVLAEERGNLTPSQPCPYEGEGEGKVQKAMEEQWYPQKGRSPGGFTLTELMIVLGLLAIVSAIGYPLLQRTVINGNLRSAARELIGDFNQQKQRAMSGDTAATGSRVHRISLSLGTNSYTLQRCTGTDIPCNGWEPLQVKNLNAFGNDIVFDPASPQTTIFDFQPRGTVTFLNNETEGTIVLRNNRGSTATIIANLSGRTFVDFDMQ
jgi:prepilin-type N-terminal cleavage/methylation domain-containing protein